MAAHVRFASENARFGQPEVNLGIIPGYGGTQRLARLVGPGRAMELCKKVMSKGPIAVSCVVNAVNRGFEMSLPDALRLEAHLFALSCATEDMKEGTQAFLEKRTAQFKGK